MGRALGVCGYRWSGEGEHTNDGRHVGYLDRRERFRALEACALLPNAT